MSKLDTQSRHLYDMANQYRHLEREAAQKMKRSNSFQLPRAITRYLSFVSKGMKEIGDSMTETDMPAAMIQTIKVWNPKSLMRKMMDMLLYRQVQIVKDDAVVKGWLEALANGTEEEKERAREGLSGVSLSLQEIKAAQQEYGMYQRFAHTAYMEEAHRSAEAARAKLKELGIEDQYYDRDVTLASFNPQDPLSTYRYNPFKSDGSPMPEDSELQAFIQERLSQGELDLLDSYRYALLEEKLRKIAAGELPPTHYADGTLIDAYNKKNEETFAYFTKYIQHDRMANVEFEYLVWLDNTYGKTEWRKKVEQAEDVALGFTKGVVKGVIEGAVDVVEGVIDLGGFAYELVLDPAKVSQEMWYKAEYIIAHPEILEEAAKKMYSDYKNGTPEQRAEMLGNVASILVPGVALTKVGKGANAAKSMSNFPREINLPESVKRFNGQMGRLSASDLASQYQQKFNKDLKKAWESIRNTELPSYGFRSANEVPIPNKTLGEVIDQYKFSQGKPGSTSERTGEGSFSPKLEGHIKYIDPEVPRSRGIGGAHNKEEFYKNDVKVLNVEKHESMPGVEKVTYQIPSIDGKTGEITGWKAKEYVKTIYDPKVISDEDYIKFGKEAANNALSNGKLGREWEGYDSNGVKWMGYADSNETVTSFFPEF